MANIMRSMTRGAILAGAALALAGGAASAAPKAYVGNFADNTVSAIDTASGKVVATIPVATGPHGMALSADGKTLYVSGDGSSSLSVIDTASDKVKSTVEVGKAPNGVTLTRDGKTLLVTVYAEDKIDFVDTKTLKITGSVAVPKPHTISIRPDGKLAYITQQEPGNFALAVIDLGKRSVVKTIPLEKTPRDAEFGYSGKAFYFTEAGVAAVQVLDPKTDQIVAQIPTGVSPHFVNLFKGTKLGIVVVQGPSELLLFDPKTNQEAQHIPVGKQPHWATLSSDGKTAYVTNEGANTLSVVDLASGKSTTIDVGKAPRKVVVQKAVAAQHADAGGAMMGMAMPGMVMPAAYHTRTTASATEEAQASDVIKISIANFAFGPAAITIHPGDTVTWSNNDGSAHTITFKDGSGGSQAIQPGESFTRKFDKAGNFDYFCSFHPYMTGKVTVAANS